MTTMEKTGVTVQVHRVFIKATPEAVWDAITSREWSERYGYAAPVEYDLRPGGAYRVLATEAMVAHGAPEVMIEGEVIEADPPRKLVQTWHALFDAETAAEEVTRLTWEIEDAGNGVTRLTVAHDVAGAPRSAVIVAGDLGREAGGGWPYILSDLKTLLETGGTLAG
ncbi:MAG: hypothetical protein QOD44_2076 [Solirubrobacteraceae bacterium]|jgi:uncharacterized protein YndB with AHSA1/START domain|nr:hypothetical protein [Solirubrobacteraceae bacterium]MEA2317887.1 hypothetical protein [Solirubrobacteraceae bacterium]